MARAPKPSGSFRLHDGDQSSPIVGRWAWDAEPGTAWAKLKDARDSVGDLAASTRVNRQTLQASGKLTEAGVDEQLLGAVPDMARAFRKAERVAANARNEIAQRRAGLTLKQPDPANLAAELGRQELRTYLRSLPQPERDAITRSENLDPKLAEAILSAPRALSGVAQMHYDRMRNQAIEAQNPGVSANLAEMEEAISVLERTIAVNREGVAREIGNKFRPQIEQIAASVLQEVDESEAKAEAAEKAAAQKADSADIFERAGALPDKEKGALIDALLADRVATATGGKA